MILLQHAKYENIGLIPVSSEMESTVRVPGRPRKS